MKSNVLAVLLFASFGFAGEEPKAVVSTFELTETIIQIENQKPLFVAGQPVAKKRVGLGEHVTTWFTIKLRPGAKSPCSSHDEEQCHIELGVAAKDADRSKVKLIDVPFRLDTEIETSTAYPIVRATSLGEKVFLFRVRFKDEILCSYEFPLEVTK